MRDLLGLALHYLRHYRWRTLLLGACLVLAFLLPLTVTWLMGSQRARMRARAEATPLVVGAPGSRYDLVLSSLYFRGHAAHNTTQRELTRIEANQRGRAVPLLVSDSVQGQPLVGTTLDYFELRHLRPQAGRLFMLPGDAVLGATAWERLGAELGGSALTDDKGLFEIGLRYKSRLRIVGRLAPTGTPDDEAVFVDLVTAWWVAGLAHQHAEDVPEDNVLGTTPEGAAVLGAGVEIPSEVNVPALDTLHFHGDEADRPLSAILVWPAGERGATILRGRYAGTKEAQLLEPAGVVDEILGFVAALKRFFDANTLAVALATALFLVLVLLLQWRAREGEFRTLARIGVPRRRVVALIALELLLVLLVAAIVAAALGWALAGLLERSLGL